MAFEPKLVRTARLIPFPLVRSGNISDTISQLIGPKDICNGISASFSHPLLTKKTSKAKDGKCSSFILSLFIIQKSDYYIKVYICGREIDQQRMKGRLGRK